MESQGALEIAKQRTERLEGLNDAAEAARVHADALDALVEALGGLRVPVARYEPHWRAVEERLRKDAGIARRKVSLALDRVQDMQRSIEAREQWTPRRKEPDEQLPQ